MKRVHLAVCLSLTMVFLFCGVSSHAQQTVAATTNAAAQAAVNDIVPPLVNFSGVLSDGSGKPLTDVVGVTFSLYREQQGGAALWVETQNVQPDATGHYSVTLGATTSTGLPGSLFAAGEAHWLGVQVQGQEEQPRVLLVSAPYALKAGDAETIGGLPPSAFVRVTTHLTHNSDSGNLGAWRHQTWTLPRLCKRQSPISPMLTALFSTR